MADRRRLPRPAAWRPRCSTASPLGWPNVSLTGLKPSRSRNMIAQGTLPAVAARQRLAEQLADPAAVGQAGQHVHIGEVGQPLLGLADLGDVGADAAEALEPAGDVDDRIAGEARSSACRARVFSSISRLVERLAREQDAAERGCCRRAAPAANGRSAGWPSGRAGRSSARRCRRRGSRHRPATASRRRDAHIP